MPDSATLPPDIRTQAAAQALPEAIVQVSALRAALTFVKQVIDRRNTIPSICAVLVAAHPACGGQPAYLELTGTNLDQQARRRVKASVAGAFRGLIDPIALNALLINLPRLSDLLITFDGRQSEWRLQAAEARLSATMATVGCAGDFPLMEDGFGPAPERAVPAAMLSGALARCTPYVSTELTRYYLNGIYLHPYGPSTRAVATDGHRLMQTAFDAEIDVGTGVILPHSAVTPIQSLLLGQETAHWSLHPYKGRGDHVVRVRTDDGAEIVTKLIDGTFPDYERVIPVRCAQAITLRCPDLRRALRLSIAAHDQTRSPAVVIRQGEEGFIELTSRGHAGVVATRVAATVHPPLPAGTPLCAVNARYLIELIDSFGTDTIIWNFTTADEPQRFAVPDCEDRACLMPMRV